MTTGRSVVAFSTATVLPPGRTSVVGLADFVWDDDDVDGDGDLDVGCALAVADTRLLDKFVADGAPPLRECCDG